MGKIGRTSRSLLGRALAVAWFACPLFVGAASAQEPLQAGEGVVTRFSGTTDSSSGEKVIDVDGIAASIVDFRNPSQPPKGQHWLNEPQHHPVSAKEIGQVFGVALDDATPPNIYLTATSAFGLHQTPDNSDWMSGMWGPGGGPGTVWKLSSATGYKPVKFADIGVGGRANSGAALGNIAYDKWNRQFYVSDLETGLIHRLRSEDGTDLGQFDHGVNGRADFLEVATGQQKSLPPVPFDPNSSARIKDCPDGAFAQTPSCWNFADFRRRVWGVAVRKDAESGQVRLYYAVWSSQALGSSDFAAANDEEKRNSVWSVALKDDGDFDQSSVRQEYLLPDFSTNPADIARHGHSQPVADIAFCKCKDENIMLVAERGSVRNLGLGAEEPFAAPHQSRVLRYELENGVWQPKGRYDVGYYDRKNDGQPYVRANSSGGVDFGYGYQESWSVDLSKPDEFVWMNGDLCSTRAPCFVPDVNKRIDGSNVDGSQGTPEFAFEEVLPPAATQPYPPSGVPYPPTGPTQSWMIDTDTNVDASGAPAMDSLTAKNATMIGDIEIYQQCDGAPKEPPLAEGPPVVDGLPVVEEPPGVEQPPIVEPPPVDEGPDLQKVKTGPAQCIEGDICTFTVAITNNGPGEWSGPLWELDTLPPGAILIDYRPQPDWLCSQLGGQVTCNYSWATLGPGDSVTLEMDVLIPAGTAGQIVENCVDDIWLPSQDPNDPAVILAVEQALAGYGYVVGPVDGVLDIVTMNAVAQFQSDNGLPQTSVPDQALIDLLFPGTAGLPGDYNPANDRDCHQVEILPASPAPAPPDIQVLKLQTSGQCRPGGLCTFRLLFINRGPGDWTGVPEVMDTVPSGASLVNPPVGCTQSGNTVTCRYPQTVTLPPNSPGSVTITIRLPGNVPSGTQNCVDLSPAIAANDPSLGNNRHCVPIRLASPQIPDIRVYKEQSAACYKGGTCSFDLWLINRGPGIWSDQIRLTDRLPVGVKLLTASPPWTCSQSGVHLACHRPAVRLNPGRGVRATVSVQLPDHIYDGALNCVLVSRPAGKIRDLVPSNDHHCIQIDVTDRPPPAKPTDISVDKVQTGSCSLGGICTFKFKFINNGPGAWTGKPGIRDEFSRKGASISSWSPATWMLKGGTTFEHEEVTISPDGYVELTLGLQIPEDASADEALENCVYIFPEVTESTDSDLSNNRKCIPVNVTEPQEPETMRPPAHASDLEIKKSLAPYNPAGSAGGCESGCIIRLVITNVGSATWSGPLVVRDMSLPPGTNMVRGMALSMAQPNWSCNASGQCSNPSVRLEPGEGRALDFYVALSEVPQDHWRNCAEIVKSGDQNPTNDRHCIDIPVSPPKVPVSEPPPPPLKPSGPGNIQIEKSQDGDCKPGSVCNFVVSFTNAGTSTWTGIPRISDVITASGAKVTTWAPQDWQCQVTAHAANCTHEKLSLPAGQSISLNYSMEIPSGLTRSFRNCAIRLGSRDANAADDRQCIPVQTAAPEPEFAPHPPTAVQPESPETQVHCPSGTVKRGKKCVTIDRRCPPGTVKKGKKCVGVTQVRCPRGTVRRGKVCVKIRPPRHCPPGMTRIGNACVDIPAIINTIRPPKGPPRREPRCHRGPDGRVHCGPG